MVDDREAPKLTNAHMLVLAVFAREPFACAEDVAMALGAPADVVAKLCADLEAAGMIEPAPTH